MHLLYTAEVGGYDKFFQTFITLTRKETATEFIQLVHVATCNSAWAQLEEVPAR